MIKKIVITLGVLLLIIGVGAHYFLSNLDFIVKAAIEKYGTEVTRTAVKVDNVKISLSSGEGSVSGMTVANPPAFSSPSAFEMGSISVKVDEKSIVNTKGPIIISEIIIEKPVVMFEVNNSGSNNLQTILQNVKSYSVPPSQNTPANTEAPANKGESRKVIVRNLTIRDGSLKITNKTLLQGQDISAPLSEIHLTDIGKSSGGTDPSQVAKQVFGAISTTSIKDASTALTKQLKSLNVNDVINKNTGNVSDKLKGLVR